MTVNPKRGHHPIPQCCWSILSSFHCEGGISRDKCPRKTEDLLLVQKNLEKQTIEEVSLFSQNINIRNSSRHHKKKISVTGIYLASLMAALQMHQGLSHGYQTPLLTLEKAFPGQGVRCREGCVLKVKIQFLLPFLWVEEFNLCNC